MRVRYSAPWSTPLTLVSALLAGIALLMVASGAGVALAMLGGVVGLAAAFAVRGYTVGPDAIGVRRLGWETRLDLRSLESAQADPEAMRLAWRTFGIGGPFAFVGWFRNGRLGSFRAYATDRDRAVVLRWPGRTVVVTPDDPDAFVAAVEAAVARL